MNDNKTISIFVTGGHLTPALAVIDEIRDEKKPWDILFVGRKHALEGDTAVSEEYTIVSARRIPFLSITAGRIKRELSWRTLSSIVKIPIGFFQAFWYCLRYHPTCIMSFGGYVAVPVAVAGWLLGIPVVTHEQTRTMGLANKLIACIADRVLLTYSPSAGGGKKGNRVVTGLPIRKEFFTPPKKPSFRVPAAMPIIYVAGGITGSTSVNEHIFSLLPELLHDAVVVHQTGHADYDTAMHIVRKLDPSVQDRYIPFTYVDGKDASWIMHHMSLYIGRSGANTVAEIGMLKKQAIFIPLPWSGNGEQQENAEMYAKTGYARIFDQTKSTTESLRTLIYESLDHVRDDRQVTYPTENRSARQVVEHIQSVLETHG